MYAILNPIYQEIHGINITQEHYDKLIKILKMDRSISALARIKEFLILEKDNLNESLSSPENRKIFMMNDDTINTINLNMTELKEKKILILSIIKDVEKNIIYLKKFIEDVNDIFDKTSYYFITNNNKDNTNNILKLWMDEYSDIIFGNFINDIPICDNNKSFLRNECFKQAKQHFGIDFDYIVILDTNLSNYININNFIRSFELNEDFDIICANKIFNKSLYYSDVYSLRLLEDDIDISKNYKYFNKFINKSLYWIDKLYCFNTFYKVSSAFGGIMILNKKLLKLNNLYNESLLEYESEHVSLCTKFKNIYINPYLIIDNNLNVEGILYPSPTIFIPSDTGLFGVLNSLMCTILNGYRVYPFFNMSKFIEKNKQNKNFCYMGNDNNSWFNYFEPIKFYEGDDTHESNKIYLFNNIQETENINDFKNIYNDIILRKKINKFYTTYFKINQDIINSVNEISCIKKIGILYRHPSHNNILFETYFKKIDKILLEYPESEIYLVTDTDLAIGAFKHKYGNKVQYDIESGRTTFDSILSWAKLDNGENQYHHECCRIKQSDPYKNGRDIIKNALILSKCDWFIFPESNISIVISYMNPFLEMININD
jgi:hypothetical protein